MLQNTGVNTRHVCAAPTTRSGADAPNNLNRSFPKKEKPETCFKTDTQQHDAYKKKEYTHTQYFSSETVC
jgi:hypothetical protein